MREHQRRERTGKESSSKKSKECEKSTTGGGQQKPNKEVKEQAPENSKAMKKNVASKEPAATPRISCYFAAFSAFSE